MKIVVTGALGHIGSRLIRELPFALPGAQIVMLDNLATQRYCSLFDLPADGEYQFLEADILAADLDSIFEGAEAVIHLAAIADAAGSFRMKDAVESINVQGTEKVARACLKGGSAMLFPSTTSVSRKPQSPYAHSKLKAEESLQEMREKGLRFIICRFGTVFGVSPGMRFHTAVNKFCWQAALGQPLSVWRTALDQVFPYLELGDAVQAIQFVVKENLFDSQSYDVFTALATVRNVIEILSSLVPDLSIEYGDVEGMNQISCEVSNERFLSLGFQFQGDLKKGITEILHLLRSAYQPNALSPRIPTKP